MATQRVYSTSTIQNSLIAPVNSIQNSYRVVLNANGQTFSVDVFANSQSEAINTAKFQTNPSNASSLSVVSINSINSCSIVAGNVDLSQSGNINNSRNNPIVGGY